MVAVVLLLLLRRRRKEERRRRRLRVGARVVLWLRFGLPKARELVGVVAEQRLDLAHEELSPHSHT